jgi:DNA mismatch repair ATPase MutS
VLPIIFSYSILGKYTKQINTTYGNLGRKSKIIAKYAQLLKKIENTEVRSALLVELKNSLIKDGKKPSGDVRHLSKILQAFDNRLNLVMGILLNIFLLWDIVQSKRAEKWIVRHRESLPVWLNVIAETDALISLATFHFNNPDTRFPTISEREFDVQGESIGHPIIPAGQLVSNPIHLDDLGQFHIITGANMAGKSTYLRTIGVSMVLAMAGSPVRAESFIFSPVKIMTSIKTSDSLRKNESYFYAELKNLQRIIDALERGETLLILLDEILKGTNSKDKQQGSWQLLKKLLSFKVSGLVATHDLSLGELEKEYPGKILNKSFEVVIQNDQLVFDYLLKEGVARQMNATFLMKKMGITG